MTHFEVFSIGKIQNNEKGTFIEIESRFIPALTALEGFSHINVLWWFSNSDNKNARNTLQTPQPYKNAPKTMGTFATRSPNRPNPIALTTSEIIYIDYEKGVIQITFIDADNNSPVLDIKPYTPSLDRVETPDVPKWCSHWPKNTEESGHFDWDDVFNF